MLFHRVLVRVLVLASAVCCLMIPAATALGANNGDVWVDNVGQPPGPGHEQDPHLACQNINLWGNDLNPSSGTYTIDGWPPSGTGEQDYAGNWTYNTATGGDQVVDVINVQTLIANAIANGDTPQANQGFHFKLQYSANPQKHKTFWVDCGVPAISTVASSTTIGGSIHDVATLTGGNSPTGTISWNVYSAADTACASPLNSKPITVSVNGDGTYTSPNFTPSAPGSYQWVASYSGDSQNLPVSTSCNDPNEVSTVSMATPAIVTDAASAMIGQPIHDVATLSGGYFPSGNISWNVYSASDTRCSTPLNSTPLMASVSGDGTYTSPNFTPPGPGSYQWVATYLGDLNNNSVATQCNDPNEVSTVSKASPAIATNASSAAAGQPLVDTATLTGGDKPTGTISWNVYSVTDTSCKTPLNTSSISVSVNGDGTYTSPGFTPSTAGSYQWVATYSGDANNNSAVTACNDPTEVSTVGQTTPAISTTASSTTAGGSIDDTATLSGGDNPSGTISWNVYSASDTSCKTPLNTSSISMSVSGDGTYTSPGFTPSTAGSYQWVATYSGDANNGKVVSPCNDASEVSTVTPLSPAISTSASSATAGGSIHDVATLTGGDNPSGTITWNVYKSSDTACATPLNTTPITVSVSGDGMYTSPNYTPASAGSYQWVATYSGDANNNTVATRCDDPTEVSTVSPATPAIATTASSATAGGTIHDVATLTGGDNPSGTISWNVYSASDTSCGTPLNSTPITVSVSGDGTYTSPNYTPAGAGSYQWVATYLGDTNNVSVATTCNDPTEVSTVSKASPAIATNASSGTVGGSIQDVATLSGGFFPSGTISWNVYSASDTSCGTPLNSSPITVSVSGDGTYTSPGYTPSAPGSYQWVATYGGDLNNVSVATTCNDPNEVSTVSKASPAIATTASSAAAGQPLVDVATLTGGDNPSGTISWTVYSASDTSCGTPLNSSPITVPVSGDGTYTSPGYTPSTAGSYQWVATYSGDANNAKVTTKCNDPNEVSTVGQTTPAIATTASSATAGGSVHDVATLSGGDNPSGTISWNVYTASDTMCSTPLNTSPITASVSGDGTYTSPDYTPSTAGSYQWVATYSGDANNAKVASRCNDPNEVSTVSPASPAIATDASSAKVGQPLVDVATLSGGDHPSGTISWDVYDVSDTSCSTPLNTSPITVPVSGDGTYTSPGYTPAGVGSYQWVATYSGDANNSKVVSSCNDPNEVSEVGLTTPAIATTASSATAGGSVHDVATLSGGDNPSGTISWNVYSASDTSCSTPLNASPITVPVSGDGTYTSPDYTPSTSGSYQWVATYSGDANNTSMASNCGDPNEVSTVSPATPAIATTASSGTAGGSIHDVATLTGGDNPSGTISWNVYSTSDTSCSTPLNSSPITVSVSGDGTYTSPDYTPAGPGSDEWVATYSGDANNTGVASRCDDPNEVSTVSPATPAIATTASSATTGGSIHDVATLTGGDNPSGTISWNVYRTSDTSCATPLNSSPITLSVSGDGTYTSPDYTPAAAGSYEWVATYSGDGNNAKVATRCDDPSEVSTVTTPSAPAIHVLKLQRVGSSGPFTTGTVTGKVGETIEYEIQVTNTGNAPLTLSLSDPHCAAGTVKGPFAISGSLSGDVLAPGAEAEYTCSHVLSGHDPAVFTNTATVTGRPPTGPPVSGTSSVSAKKQAVSAVKVVRCGRGKVKKAKRVHGKTVYVCVRKPVKHHPKPLPTFTG